MDLLEEAEEAMETGLGREHPMTLCIKHSLALNYWELERIDESRQLLDIVVNIRNRVLLGDGHPHTLESSKEWGSRFQASTYPSPLC